MKIEKIETNYKRNMFLDSKIIKSGKYKESIENKVINAYKDIQKQQFIGFGGAITQATGETYKKLSSEKQKEFLYDYFVNCNYNILRLPIGSCDFSREKYSYSNKKDLSDFSIEKDKEYLIPLVKDILEMRPGVQFLASPWSPPSFMKTNKMLTLGGRLLEKYYGLYADYLVRYIKAYKELGVEINYITIQNEPNAIQIWESCLFTAKEELDFIKNYLYPSFKENNIETKILIYDHNKEKMYKRADEIINKFNEVDGIAYHWYTGDHFENIELCSRVFKDKLLIHTEGCVGFSKFNPDEEVKNAEIYAHDILGDLTHGCNGYIDWNMLLDHKGGPNHKLNYCNSPIMLKEDSDEYYKNLCYYYIAQFSKVVMPGAHIIATSRYTENIEVVACINKDNSIGIVLLNRNDKNFEYNLCIEDMCIHDNLDSHAIVSYLIKE